MQWRTKRSGKSGAKYWFRNNVSVELLAVAFALAKLGQNIQLQLNFGNPSWAHMNRPPATKNFFYNTIDENDGNFCLCSDICYHYFLIRVIFCLYNFIQKVEIFPCLIIAGCIAEHSERKNNVCQVGERRANQHSTDDMHSKLEMFLESATKNRVCKLTTLMSLARKYISLSCICILTGH